MMTLEGADSLCQSLLLSAALHQTATAAVHYTATMILSISDGLRVILGASSALSFCSFEALDSMWVGRSRSISQPLASLASLATRPFMYGCSPLSSTSNPAISFVSMGQFPLHLNPWHISVLRLIVVDDTSDPVPTKTCLLQGPVGR